MTTTTHAASNAASPPPGSNAPGDAGSGREAPLATDETIVDGGPVLRSVPVESLAQDPALNGARKALYQNREVPEIGGIYLLRKLGQGGMGSVYLGMMPMLKKYCAVKIVPNAVTEPNPEIAERFIREAQIAAKVESPHLVRVTDANQDRSLLYIVMEYVHGKTAKQLCAACKPPETGLDESVALRVALAAARGLKAAHELGIIHRDIKPDNILIPCDEAGGPKYDQAKLTDLGLARAEYLVGPSLTQTNIPMGTYGFMAPEQVESAKDSLKATDVFGLGATLYTLLAGRPPYQGVTLPEVLMATLQGSIVPIAELRPGLSAVTAALLGRCLARDPARRFVDAAALVPALEIALDAHAKDAPAQGLAIARLDECLAARERGAPAQPLAEPTRVALPRLSARRRRLVMQGLSVAALLLAGLLALWLAHPRGTDGPAGYESSMKAGLEAEAREDWPAALQAYAHALTARPNDPRAERGLKAAAGRMGMAYPAEPSAARVRIGFASALAKFDWIAAARDRFNALDRRKQIDIDVLPLMGSDAMQEILAGNKGILMWSPSNYMYHDLLTEAYQKKHNAKPFYYFENIAITPFVIVLFDKRHEALEEKYKRVDFDTLRDALAAPSGWKVVNGRQDWGAVKLAFPSLKSGDGLGILLLLCMKFYGRDQISAEDLQSSALWQYLLAFKPCFRDNGTVVSVLNDMLAKGPGTLDGVVTHESAILAQMDNLKGRGLKVRVVYPTFNLWNENPCYVLNAPGATDDQRELATEFLAFMRGKDFQAELVRFGLRPTNLALPIVGENSPFELHKSQGFQIDIPNVARIPGADVARKLHELARKLDEAPAPASP
ncbi:MAG: protein kinase [Planctomycetota bacterium]|nr:protein kinase [Planctomycetota bacterium]